MKRQQAVQLTERHRPTIALLDIGLPRLSGIDVARSIKRLVPNTAIVFLSGQHDMDIIQTALDLGSGYVLKSDTASDLIAGIYSVARGETFVSRQLASLGITTKREEVTGLEAPE